MKSLGSVIELSDSALSKNLAPLEEEGMVGIEKGRLNRKPRTWAHLTPAGLQAFHAYLEALRATIATKFLGLEPEH